MAKLMPDDPRIETAAALVRKIFGQQTLDDATVYGAARKIVQAFPLLKAENG